jgi:hypothetical protein
MIEIRTPAKRFMMVMGLLALAGCSAVSGAQSVAPQAALIEAATIIGTDKTIGDHVVSFATNKNCSTVRKQLGKHYCEEDEIGRVDEVYCYRTLAKVTCYAVPSPHGETQRVDHVSPGSPPPR